jgi:hypothetical protein
MAGYVFSNATGIRLMATIAGTDPADYLPRRENQEMIPDLEFIEKAITDHMAAKLPQSKGVVTVTLTATNDNLETILVTQECLLTRAQRLNGPLPVTTEGEREECVRQWLESNGNRSPCYCFLLSSILTVSTGVGRDEYKWDTRHHDDADSGEYEWDTRHGHDVIEQDRRASPSL